MRTADILTDTQAHVYSLNTKALLELNDPLAARVMMKLLSNLFELSHERLAHMDREVKILNS